MSRDIHEMGDGVRIEEEEVELGLLIGGGRTSDVPLGHGFLGSPQAARPARTHYPKDKALLHEHSGSIQKSLKPILRCMPELAVELCQPLHHLVLVLGEQELREAT